MPKLSHCLVALSLVASFQPLAAHSSDICDQLAFSLSSLQAGTGQSAETSRFDAAIAAVEDDLSSLDAKELAAGCSSDSIIVLRSEENSDCRAFQDQRALLVDRIETLTDQRLAAIAAQDLSPERNKILAALRENRCDERRSIVETPGIGEHDLVETVPLGEETLRRPGDSPFDNKRTSNMPGEDRSGTFRTMCVRTCDGGFFPISSRASSIDFSRDAEVCAMMCPNTETELFYTGLEEESSAMRSARDGKPYSELPHAFAFRKNAKRASQCGCDFAGFSRRMARLDGSLPENGSPEKASSIVRLTTGAPSSSSITEKPITGGAFQKERAYIPDRKIRNVGPTFFPDDGGPAGASGTKEQSGTSG